MAGKKRRKRQTAPKKKENINVESALIEEKKAKLDDRLNEQVKQSDEHVQQPILETKVEDNKNDAVSEDLSPSLQTVEVEESKYVPPFTRKPKKILKRDGSSVSPSVRTARAKRPWKGREANSKETRQSPRRQKTSSDVVCRNESPKLRKEEKEQEEEEVIYVGMEEVVIWSQENNNLPADSTSQTAAADEVELTVTTDGVLSSSPLVTIQEDISAIVMHVIDDVLDTICKHVNQCNEESTSECEGIKKSGEESNTRSDVDISNEDIKCSQEDSVAEAGVALTESSISEETAMKPSTVLTKAALKTFTSRKAATKSVKRKVSKKQMAKAGSESPLAAANVVIETRTTIQEQEHSQPPITTELVAEAERVKPTASEDALEEYDKGVGGLGVETLQNCCHMLENEHTMRQQKETDKKPCNKNDTVRSEDECVHKSEAELKNPVADGSTVITPEVKNELLTGKEIITSINEELHAMNTSPMLSVHTEPNSADISPANSIHLGLEKEHLPHSNSEHLPKPDDKLTEHTCTETDQKANMDTPVSDNQVSNKNYSDASEDKENISQQGLDQMVPNNYENSTVMSQETPDATESTRIPKVKEMTIDYEDSVYVHSKPLNRGDREDKNYDLDMNIDQVSVVQTVPTKTTNRSNLESSQPLCTTQVSDVSFQQEPGKRQQVTVDQTVTGTKSTVQNECKQVILETEEAESPEKVESKITENQMSKLEGGCSLYASDDDILEFDCLMDCSDSQLVHVDELLDDKPPLPSLKHNASNVAENDTVEDHVEVPSDRGMIKGLISELSTLNKFIMGAWKDLESQRKRRQARLKLGKGKKLK